MCGLLGVLNTSGRSLSFGKTQFRFMLSQLSHRGPNSMGIWNNGNETLVFGHTRLSIVDLSSAGSQPMHSSCGKYTIILNGEIYNYKQLRQEIEQKRGEVNWRGASDTEVLINLISFLGVERAISSCAGMFAAAIWDHEKELLHLVRDRFGEKPLYFCKILDELMFSSELKAIKCHPKFDCKLNKLALNSYLRLSYVPDNQCIFEGVSKVQPGTIVTFNKAGRHINSNQYWSVDALAQRSKLTYPAENEKLVMMTDDLLTTVVEGQMVADVDVGAFLSGGVDSSLIVSLMAKVNPRKVPTFTVSYMDPRFDESELAQAIADHLGTEHHSLNFGDSEILKMVEELPYIYDEPFADSSQLPTLFLAKFAKSRCSVCLTGDGGDEIFAGYNRHRFVHNSWQKISKAPIWSRSLLSKFLSFSANKDILKFYDKTYQYLPSFMQHRLIEQKVQKFSSALLAENLPELYSQLIHNADGCHLKHYTLNSEMMGDFTHSELTDLQKILLWDTRGYLPGDILTKVDRASMSASLETRAPYLDHRVCEFSWSLPDNFRLNKGTTKWVLRELQKKYLPINYTQKPKMGFGVPIETLLRTSLKDWAEQNLQEKWTEELGVFDVSKVSILWNEHLSGKKNHEHILWNILMLSTWWKKEIMS